MNILNMNGLPDQSSTGLNGAFLRYQLMMNVLHRMVSPNPRLDKYELVDYCKRVFDGNEIDLKVIKEFEQTYCKQKALWWYSRESIFYRLLNKALRVQNIELLFIMRFFIRDIYHELLELQQQQVANEFSTVRRVYRGQLLSNEEHHILHNSVGNLLSMNSFFSTSTDRELTLFLVESLIVPEGTSKAVLFEIDIDPDIDYLRPFADIRDRSHISTESEVLFSLGAIFRLESIRDESEMCVVHLISKNHTQDEQIMKLLRFMEKKIGKENDLLTLGLILCESGKFDDGRRCYRRLLQEIPTNDPNVPYCYQALGDLAITESEFDDAIIQHNKALEIWSCTLSPTHPSIAVSYTSLGVAYDRKGKKDLALKAYAQSLDMFKQLFGENDEHVATCLNNLGTFYEEQQMYQQALEYHQDALRIKETIFPTNHQEMGASYHNISIVYARVGQFDLALDHCQQGLESRRASFPPDHWLVGASFEGLGCIYAEMGNYGQSLAYFQKALAIYEKHFPFYHADLRRTKISIQTTKGLR